MALYQHILAAVKLDDLAAVILNKAATIQAHTHCQVSVVNVIEPLNYLYGGELAIDFSSLQKEIEVETQHKLEQLIQQTQLKNATLYIKCGKMKTSIDELTQEIGNDLIITACSPKGFSWLLGHSCEDIIEQVSCDVLTIHPNSTA